MISNWTFDADGRDLIIHATVTQTADTYSIIWIVENRIGHLVDSGASTQRSPDDALACLRALGLPARYVSGYLRNDDAELHVGRTSHSWAEAWVPGLDWVGFDPANGISPRGDSLRVAVGLDYRDAAPVSGRRVGFGDAKMTVEASVRAMD